jgi:hypothetical protein
MCWNYFNHIKVKIKDMKTNHVKNVEQIFCSFENCPTVFSSGTSTGNYANHLKGYHNIDLKTQQNTNSRIGTTSQNKELRRLMTLFVCSAGKLYYIYVLKKLNKHNAANETRSGIKSSNFTFP